MNQKFRNGSSLTLLIVVIAIIVAGLAYYFVAVKVPSNPAASVSNVTELQVDAGNKDKLQSEDIKLEDVVKNAKGWEATLTSEYGETAPDFTVKGLDGKDIKLSDYKGKNVLLVFWTTWCVYCKDEIPHLNVLNSTMPESELAILAISDENPDAVKKFKIKKNMKYKLATTGRGFGEMGKIYQQTISSGIPAAMYIDISGKIKLITLGTTTVTQMRNIIKAE